MESERPGWRAPGAWRAWAVQAALGVARGFLRGGGVFLVEWAAGWLLVLAVAPPGAAIAALLVGAARALGVAALEETIFRGVLLGYLQRPSGTPAAVAVSALAFALVHAWNANATPLALVNLTVAGGLFGLAYLVARGPTPTFAAGEAAARGLPGLAYAIARGLALPIALHAAWNFFEGSVFGFPVSGSTRPSLLFVDVAGAELVTGGAFGPEGGLLGLGATLLTALVLWLVRGWVPRAPALVQGQRRDG